MDQISLEILKILQEKARIPNVEIARRVGMAPSAVLERIRKLEKLNIIDGYEVRLNPQAFGRNLVAFIHISVNQQAQGNKITEILCDIPEIQEVHFIAGEDGYLVKLRVAGTHELARIIQEKITCHQAIISTRTSIALETLKETANFPIDQPAENKNGEE